MVKIGIIGGGFVGKATHLLKCNKVDIIVYDIVPELCEPKGTKLTDLSECDLIFISVPTPMNSDGSCHLNILESVVNDLSEFLNLDESLVVVRSTVPPGTSDRLNCYFMPEFLTEKNFEYDFITNPEWVFGLKQTKQDDHFKKKIFELFDESHKASKIKSNKMVFLTNSEAETVKMFRNTYLSTKISFCNEVNEFCTKKNINYEKVREFATRDERIGESHTKVPGHDGRYGFGGTCFPKDTNSFLYEMLNVGMKPFVLKAVVERNETHDRKENDWRQNKGRAVVE